MAGRRLSAWAAVVALLALVCTAAVASGRVEGTSVQAPRLTAVGRAVPSALCPGVADILPCVEGRLTELALADGAAVALSAYRSAISASSFLAESCHFLLHAVGRGVGARTKAWTTATRDGTTECNLGYEHGVAEGALAGITTESAVAAVTTFCADATAWTDVGACGHGAGHQILTEANWDVGESLGTCGALAADLIRQACADGVFMAYSAAVPHLRKAGDVTDAAVLDVCVRAAPFMEKCLLYAGHLWLPLDAGNPRPSIARCASTSLPETCAVGVGRAIAAGDASTGHPTEEAAFGLCPAGSLAASCAEGVAETLAIAATSVAGTALPRCELLGQIARVGCDRGVGKVESGLPKVPAAAR